jgi:rubrerythrin
MHKLAANNPEKTMDYLTERLTFERAAVKLYDTILHHLRGSNEPWTNRIVGQVEKYRNQEKEHEEWLEAQIRALGGTAHEKTDMGSVIERESRGLLDVASTDVQLPHIFHALLTAELMDNAGWEILLELADRADDDEARQAFRKRLHEEQDHLQLAREMMVMLAKNQVLGSPLITPPPP